MENRLHSKKGSITSVAFGQYTRRLGTIVFWANSTCAYTQLQYSSSSAKDGKALNYANKANYTGVIIHYQSSTRVPKHYLRVTSSTFSWGALRFLHHQ